MNRTLLVFREIAEIAYGEGQEGPFPERDLVKAQFVAELQERLLYPLSAIRLDAPVLVEGRGFEEIDVLAANKEGEIMMAAAVESAQEYEDRQDYRMRVLYRKASALAKIKRVHWLVYYTRWYQKGGILQKRQLVVDYAKYPNYHAWQAAGFPSTGVLPGY